MKKILTIAGSDCSGGAGIQADIKTITAHRMYAMSVITALTAQNTTGVCDVFDVDADFVAKQLDCIFTDIEPDAVKVGMVSNKEIITVIAEKLAQYKAKNIVIDPVMIATNGGKLLCDDSINALVNMLLPIANIITPNIPEAENLCGFKIRYKEDMLCASQKLSQLIDGSILVKGGHLLESADDLLYVKGTHFWFSATRIETENTHGTGCTLSSAIACNLADGHAMEESVQNAKDYVYGAIGDGLDLGKGCGPLNHCYRL